MNYSDLLHEIEEYIESFFSARQPSPLLYHNLKHTQFVVYAARQIANHYSLDEQEFFIVEAAAWFHDTGYSINGVSGHEKTGAKMATSFLDRFVDDDIIHRVQNCILSTKLPQEPSNMLEKIVCDADLSHLGSDDFFEWSELLRKETELLFEIDIEMKEWRHITIGFLQEHHYHTDYCRQLLNQKKEAHLQELRNQLAKGNIK